MLTLILGNKVIEQICLSENMVWRFHNATTHIIEKKKQIIFHCPDIFVKQFVSPARGGRIGKIISPWVKGKEEGKSFDNVKTWGLTIVGTYVL